MLTGHRMVGFIPVRGVMRSGKFCADVLAFRVLSGGPKVAGFNDPDGNLPPFTETAPQARGSKARGVPRRQPQ